MDEPLDKTLLPLGTELGPYRLLEELGTGGMGVVYLAEQRKPMVRRVALKVIKPGMGSAQVLTRFDAERQALALMDHPNIARVLDAGCTDGGLPYFAMEYVPGMPITEYCDRHRLAVEQRLELFAQVANAVQHAHQKGVIHRDLKPGNVLVRIVDGEPVPKIIDFGVAKATDHRLTEQTLFTEHGLMIGTPEYMSPEQADPTGLGVDTRTDVYSLGVLLYELLVGALPFDARQLRQAGLLEIRRRIRDDDPVRPSTRFSSLGDDSTEVAERRQAQPAQLLRRLRGELDWITMRALEKDPARRYQAASDFAEDVRKYLRGEPVDAGPPSAGYRLRRTLSRHRRLVAAALAVLLALGVGLVTTLWQWQVARDEAAKATRAATEADERRAEAVAATTALRASEQRLERELERARGLRMLTAASTVAAADSGLAYALAVHGAERVEGPVGEPVLRELLRTARPERVTELQDVGTGSVWPLTTARVRDDTLLLGVTSDGLGAWRVQDGSLVVQQSRPESDRSLAVSAPDFGELFLWFGRELIASPLAVGRPGFVFLDCTGETLTIASLSRPDSQSTLEKIGLPLRSADRALSVHAGTLRHWDESLQSFEQSKLAEFPFPAAPNDGLVLGETVLLSDGDTLAAWDANDGRRLWFGDLPGWRYLTTSPDGRWIAFGLKSIEAPIASGMLHFSYRRVALADERRLRERQWIDADLGMTIDQVAFEDHGRQDYHLLAAGADGIILARQRDSDLKILAREGLDGRSGVHRVQQDHFVVAGHDAIRLVRTDGERIEHVAMVPLDRNRIPLVEHCSLRECCLFDPAGRCIQRDWLPPIAGWRHPSAIRSGLSLNDAQLFEAVEGAVEEVGAVGPPTDRFWTRSRLPGSSWSSGLGQALQTRAGHSGALWDRFDQSASYGYLVIPGGFEHGAFFEVDTGACRGTPSVYPLRGTMLGWASEAGSFYWQRDQEIVRADLGTRAFRKVPLRVGAVADVRRDLVVFDDGARLVCADLATGSERWSLATEARATALRWSADCTRVVAATAERVWCIDAATQASCWQRDDLLEATELRTAPPAVLLVHPQDGTTHVVDLATGQDRFATRCARAPVRCTAIHPDGDQIALGCSDRAVIVIDARKGRVTHDFDEPGGVFLLGFARDGTELVTLGDDGTFTFWPLDLVGAARPYARPLTPAEQRDYGVEDR